MTLSIPAAAAAALAGGTVLAASRACRARNDDRPPAWLSAALHRSAFTISPTGAWRAARLVIVVAGLGLGWAAGPAAALAGVGVAAALVVAGSALVPDRRRRQVALAVPTGLETIAQSLRAGCSVRDGVAAAARDPRLVSELAPVLAELDAGVATTTAFDRWAARSCLPGVGLAAAAVDVSLRGGSSTARAIDGVATTVREQQRVAAEVRSLATQSRLSAGVLAVAPPGFALLLLGGDATGARFLTGTATGRVCLAAGLAFDVAGWLWMRRICAGVRC